MMDLAFIARASGGVLVGTNVALDGISTDSREVAPGALFVALKGERFDGHAFVAAAFAKGAAAALVETEQAQGLPMPRVVVADTLKALGRCAAIWREQFALPLIAITGSNGKTTVKELVAAICRAATGSADAVLATRGNLNNHIGLPVMLLGLRETHRYAVLEMGMNHPGEIRYLTGIARPTVALVNNALRAHLAGLVSVEAIARAKGEIFEGLGPDGIGIVNADDPHCELWRNLLPGKRQLRFGFAANAEVRGEVALEPQGSLLRLFTPLGDTTLRLALPGEHNARNALAAAACAIAAGLGLEDIRRGLEGFRGVPGRLQEKQGLHGASIIDDSYNANPDSMRAAIDVLARRSGRRILVLGDMGELGPEAPALHAEVIGYAMKQGFEHIFVLGELMRAAQRASGAPVEAYETMEALLARLNETCPPEATILVKGSRFMRMERVVAALCPGTMEAH